MALYLELNGYDMDEGTADSMIMSLEFIIQMYTGHNEPDLYLQSKIELRMEEMRSEIPNFYVTFENNIKVDDHEYRFLVDIEVENEEFGLLIESTKNGLTSQFILASNLSSEPDADNRLYIGQMYTNDIYVASVFVNVEEGTVIAVFSDQEVVTMFTPEDLERLTQDDA